MQECVYFFSDIRRGSWVCMFGYSRCVLIRGPQPLENLTYTVCQGWVLCGPGGKPELSAEWSRKLSVVAACPAHCHTVLSSRESVQCCNAFWVMLGYKKTHLVQPSKDATLELGHSKPHLYP